MRSIVFAPVLLIISSFALAHGPSINLDQPGVLNELQQQHPQRYQAVTALLRASMHAPCPGSDLQVLKTRFNVKDFECEMVLSTSYPAKRHVSFELDGVNYEATVEFKAAETVQPISPATDLSARH